jgi:hypothetical protein
MQSTVEGGVDLSYTDNFLYGVNGFFRVVDGTIGGYFLAYIIVNLSYRLLMAFS